MILIWAYDYIITLKGRQPSLNHPAHRATISQKTDNLAPSSHKIRRNPPKKKLSNFHSPSPPPPAAILAATALLLDDEPLCLLRFIVLRRPVPGVATPRAFHPPRCSPFDRKTGTGWRESGPRRSNPVDDDDDDDNGGAWYARTHTHTQTRSHVEREMFGDAALSDNCCLNRERRMPDGRAWSRAWTTRRSLSGTRGFSGLRRCFTMGLNDCKWIEEDERDGA